MTTADQSLATDADPEKRSSLEEMAATQLGSSSGQARGWVGGRQGERPPLSRGVGTRTSALVWHYEARKKNAR